jgi:hypothetical protein
MEGEAVIDSQRFRLKTAGGMTGHVARAVQGLGRPQTAPNRVFDPARAVFHGQQVAAATRKRLQQSRGTVLQSGTSVPPGRRTICTAATHLRRAAKHLRRAATPIAGPQSSSAGLQNNFAGPRRGSQGRKTHLQGRDFALSGCTDSLPGRDGPLSGCNDSLPDRNGPLSGCNDSLQGCNGPMPGRKTRPPGRRANL